jgi:hypothetical protein
METTYSPDDLVILKSKESYEVGDVIGFRVAGGGAVIHRIVGGNEIDGFLTQGDNPDTNPHVDPWKPKPNHILGAVRLKIDRFGAFFRLMKHPFVIGAIASVTAVYVILGDVNRREDLPSATV